MFRRFGSLALLGFAIAVVSRVVRGAAEEKAEEERRKNTPFSFDSRVAQERFENAVRMALSGLRNAEETEICGPVVTVKMLSNSGISYWRFTIDFNDGGSYTGRYRIDSTHPDSLVPDRVAEEIRRTLED